MRILFLNKRILFPADFGGRIRTLNVLRHLARWHEVTYLCNLQPEEGPHLAEMRELGLRLETLPWRETPRESLRFYGALARNVLSPYPFNVNKDYDRRLRRRAAELLASEAYDLLICDFVQMARNAVGLKAPARILFEHNVEAQIFQRHAQSDRGLLRRAYMRHQWRKMRRFEGEAGRRFDAVIAVSRQDRETFEREYGWRHVQVIGTAVDVDSFRPNATAEVPERLVFVGSMDWLPNRDGVAHFVANVWPAIREKRPLATFQIVGRNPSPAVRQLGRVPGVEVVGTVPDTRPYLARAAVVVVPLLVGGGTRMKIYEAMAMAKPVVSTPLGAEGLDLNDGEHALLAESPAEFAGAVVRLLADRPRRRALGVAARRLVVESDSAEAVARQFEAICRTTVESVSRGAVDRPSRKAQEATVG